MLKLVVLPWFIARLLFTVSPTLVELLITPFRRWENTLIAVVVVSVTLGAIITQLPKTWLEYTPTLPLVTLFKPTSNELENQVVTHLELLERQPNNRDLLLNLAILYSNLGNTEASQMYAERARELDPNHEYFKD